MSASRRRRQTWRTWEKGRKCVAETEFVVPEQSASRREDLPDSRTSLSTASNGRASCDTCRSQRAAMVDSGRTTGEGDTRPENKRVRTNPGNDGNSSLICPSFIVVVSASGQITGVETSSCCWFRTLRLYQ